MTLMRLTMSEQSLNPPKLVTSLEVELKSFEKWLPFRLTLPLETRLTTIDRRKLSTTGMNSIVSAYNIQHWNDSTIFSALIWFRFISSLLSPPVNFAILIINHAANLLLVFSGFWSQSQRFFERCRRKWNE